MDEAIQSHSETNWREAGMFYAKEAMISTAPSMSGNTPRCVDSSEWMMVPSVSITNRERTDMPRSSLNTP